MSGIVRVFGLAVFLKAVTTVVTTGAKLLLSSDYFKISAPERAALEGLVAAAQALQALLPIPGVDADPGTIE